MRMRPAPAPAPAVRRCFHRAWRLATAILAASSCSPLRRQPSTVVAFSSPSTTTTTTRQGGAVRDESCGAPPFLPHRPHRSGGRGLGPRPLPRSVPASPHHGGRSVPVPPLDASSGGGDAANDGGYDAFLRRTPQPAGVGGVALPFPLPSLTQALSVWAVGVSANRVVQRLLTGQYAETEALRNLALNGAVLVGACFFLIKTLRGINYPALEGFEQKSLANQAGRWALHGQVPLGLKASATAATANDDGNSDDGGDRDDDNRNDEASLASYEVATFAGGCFWGTELRFQRIPGVIATCVGYTHGAVAKPTYERVCSGTTGHAEGVQLLFDPAECSYKRLLTQLFATIDPTMENRVGGDSGTQYRHGVYPHTREQYDTARTFFRSVQAQCAERGQGAVVTELKPAAVFWPAEGYHQRYLEKRGQSAEKECTAKVRCYG